jgi:hypothetical protein
MKDNRNFAYPYFGDTFAPGGCRYCFILLAQSYLLFFLLWKTTVLCLVYPAIWACFMVYFAKGDHPRKQKLSYALFIAVTYSPMILLFVVRWFHLRL